MTLIIILIYLALVASIGLLSRLFFRDTVEDYFVATRSIGPFILLMSLFGTHMTAFSILGASGEAYHGGIGVFALMASSSAIVVPAVFYFIGVKAWFIGKRHGFLTQVQFFRERWNSEGLGILLFILLVIFLIPYLLIGVMGGGITLNQLTDGQVPEWIGSFLVCAVVLFYVTFGGLRATAWANTFQTLVFMTLGGVAFFAILKKLGGLENALNSVIENNPALLIRGDKIQPLNLLTYTCIPLSAAMFPHLFMHWLSAKRAESFKIPLIFYPVCIAIVWVPSVLLGVFGNIDFPGLEGPAANSVLVMMLHRYAPEVLAGLLGAGVFAAIMSSLDSQSLSLGTMFTQDIVRHFKFKGEMPEKLQVLYGRLFVAAILILTFLLSLVSNRSIFRLGIWSFTGFASLTPIVVAALYWRRSTKTGAFASAISVIVLWTYFFIQSWENPGATIGGTGILPVAVILMVSALAMTVGTLLSKAPDEMTLQKFFPGDTG